LPKNYYARIRAFQICDNTLTYIDHAVAFEIEVWNFLQRIMTAKDMNDGELLVRPWIQADRQFITCIVSYELGRTMSRMSQIASLQK
jgi:hypothetical protein